LWYQSKASLLPWFTPAVRLLSLILFLLRYFLSVLFSKPATFHTSVAFEDETKARK
jgi:hypothetical protein